MTDSPRRCVYTVLTGRYEKLLEQQAAVHSALPFICFTDDLDLVSKTWQIRQFTPLLGADFVRSQREVKLLPHKYLPEFDQSLYIDNSVLLKLPPEEMFAAACLASGLSLPAHSYRATLFDEFARVISSRLDDPARIEEQLEYYQAANPDILRRRPFWNAVLLRDHHNPAMIAAMELWLTHILRFSRRDQLSGSFVFDRVGLRPDTLEIDNFNSRFHSWPHVSQRNTERRTWQKPGAAPSENLHLMTIEARYRDLAKQHEKVLTSTTWRAAAPLRQVVRLVRQAPVMIALQNQVLRQRLLRAALPKQKSRWLIFAFAPPASAFASAVLRGQQLMTLIEQASGSVECRTSTLKGLLKSEGQTVVLTKSALYNLTPEQLAQLRQRKHRLIADFIDVPINPALAKEMHALIASSVMQARYLRTQFPEIPVYLITHHVDLRLPKVSPPADRPRFGYFGRPGNLLHGKAIQDLVSIVPAHSPSRRGWMGRLAEFNAHCALRAPEGANIFKPFTKGFIAAHCGAPIIVGADDAEARHYLGPDYKFVIEDLSLPGVRAQLAAYASAFGTPAWNRAVETMRGVAAKSGQSQVKAELLEFVDGVL